MKDTSFPTGDANLKDHGLRSSRSVVLHIAEGKGRGWKAEKNCYRIALGEAGDAHAMLDLVDLPRGDEQQAKLRRVGAMLSKMSR